MAFLNIPLTKENFNESKWQAIIDSCPIKTCETYRDKFSEQAKIAQESEIRETQEVFTILSAITSLFYNTEHTGEPFIPQFVFPSHRSAAVQDFSQEQLKTLKSLIPDILDNEMKARVADVIWIREKDYTLGEVAVTAYLKSAIALEDLINWPYCYERIHRAVAIAISLGRDNSSFKNTIAHIELVLEKHKDNDPSYLSLKLMEILLKHRIGDPEKYIYRTDILAKKATTEKDWNRARAYFEVKAKWHALAKNIDEKDTALRDAAETLIKEAEAIIKNPKPSYFRASLIIQKAIQLLRTSRGSKERIIDLHKLLSDYQSKSMSEMQSVPLEMNIQEFSKEARDFVKVRNFNEALLLLSLIRHPIDYADLRFEIQNKLKKFSISTIFETHIVNNEGKVISKKPSTLSTDPNDAEALTLSEMFQAATIEQNIFAQAYILPAIDQINKESYYSIQDIETLLSYSPLIPPDRLTLISKAFYFGLKKDHMLAAHLLIPQIENCIRHILQKHGHVVSSLNSEGIQQEQDLNKTLYMDKLKEIFGINIVFELRGLLIEKCGSNLRHEMAHGLMPDNPYTANQIFYLLWLTLHIFLMPVINTISAELNHKKE